MKKPRIWAEINLEDLRHNLQAIKRHLAGRAKVMAVVKADAYGHGSVPVSIALWEFGVDMFGVGDSSEALELRGVGINTPIVILGGIVDEEIERVVKADITPTLHSVQVGQLVNAEARRQGKVLNVHVMIDTGMGRLGTSPRHALELIEALSKLENLRLEGICSHFSSSPFDRDFTRNQFAEFQQVVAAAETAGYRIPIRHMANSAGCLLYEETALDMVRIGGALLGMDPAGVYAEQFGLRPILSFRSQIVFLKWIPKGSPVGYDRTFIAPRDTRVATTPVGYHDGYSYLLSNRGSVIIRGRRVPVIGGVTMDYTMLDVTDLPEVAVGDEIVLIGSQGNETISAVDVAQVIGTNPYEVTCLLGKRVRRIHIRNALHSSAPPAQDAESVPQAAPIQYRSADA